MNRHPADDAIKDVFDNNEFEYNPRNWEKLSSLLDQKRSGKGLILPLLFTQKTAMAACIVAILCCILYPILHTNTPESVTAFRSTAVTAARVLSSPAQQAATTVMAVHNPVTTTPANRIISNQKHQTCAAISQPLVTIETTDTTNLSAAPAITRTTATPIVTAQKPDLKPAYNAPADQISFPMLAQKPAEPAASLGVSGGYNHGLANSGFAFGINGSTRISKRLALEGDIAYIRNNNPTATSDVSDLQYKAMSNSFSSDIAAASIERIDVNKLNTLSYLQFAPSLSYRLGNRFHIGIGADIQQMLAHDQSNDNVIYLKDYDMKILPRTDIGYTGKVNYNISQRIKAGLLYREGLQASFDKKYFNRRYVQFTFQFALLQR